MSTPQTEPLDSDIVARVRERADLQDSTVGPSDANIVAGVRGFAREFQYWYGRVLDEALPKYQKIIIDRINPMIRGMQLQGLGPDAVAKRLLADYAHRNYVTAGGWALEQLAIAGSPRLRKSTAAGIDAEWHESGPPPAANLYVIKSGTVTRNSDILKALKGHGQEAQKRLLQTDKRAIVRVYYIVTAGQKSSTFHDGVHRPSSAEFWAQAFALENKDEQAVELVLAMAQEAGSLLPPASETALPALELAVASFIAADDEPGTVDWEFLARRNMVGSAADKAVNKKRDARARKAVTDAGYVWPSTKAAAAKEAAAAEEAAVAEQLAEEAASLTPQMQEQLSQMLPLPEAD